MRPLVLGSTSPFRRELLGRLGLPFEVAAPQVDEARYPGEGPEVLVRRLAEAKARAAALNFPEALVIGSDQVALIDGEVLGKPGDFRRAFDQLRAASGRRVSFFTGLCLFNAAEQRAQVDLVPFEVEFLELTDRQIEGYLRKEEPYQCAGAFKSEGLGTTLFRRLLGDDPTALIGLPLIRLTAMLRAEGVEPLAL